jgi:hypothetical protein
MGHDATVKAARRECMPPTRALTTLAKFQTETAFQLHLFVFVCGPT